MESADRRQPIGCPDRRREYNEERLKKSPGGLTPAAYAMQLATKAATMMTSPRFFVVI